MSYVMLHDHTQYSLLDGLTDVEGMVKKAKDNGCPAVAITDHGVAYGLVKFTDACKKAGIKPILGVEFYEAPESRFIKEGGGKKKKDKEEDEPSKQPYNHLILLVKNAEGYKNLCKLVTRSNTEGFYYKPRIDWELLENNHEGLICLSACLAGRIPRDIVSGNLEQAEKDILHYKEIFGDDFYLEIQNHGIPEEALVVEELYKLSQKTGVKLVGTNDVHYLNSEDAEAHEWLLCMQTGKTIEQEHMKYEGDYSFKTEEEMRALFPSIPEAIDNTLEVAEKIEFDLTQEYTNDDINKYRMPKVEIPPEWGEDYYGYLEHITWKGYEERYPEGHPYREEAKPRIEKELAVIKKMNFAKYFLSIKATIDRARAKGIIVGVGRGSGAGSAVNYCMHITDLEPLRYGLIFERFLNEERISMPDIDTDFDYAHKEDVIRAEAEFNGHMNFCKIQTLQGLLAKSVLRDVMKVAGLPTSHATTLAKMIPDGKSVGEKHMTLKKAREQYNPEIEQYLSQDAKLRQAYLVAEKIEGCKKSGGTHACGHIPTPVPCEELFPCRVDGNGDVNEGAYLVCEYDMTEAEHLGNLKQDLLMLRNLTIIQVAHDGVMKHFNKDVPLWNDDILYDKEALKTFWTGNTNGVFQFESPGMKKFMSELKPDTFEDIIAGVALYRPGPMDYIPDYIKGKKDPKSITYITPELEPILKTTYGVIVYQEQVMKICTDLAGFTMGHADIVRKAMGKKKAEIMDEERPKFIAGCVGNGISEENASEIWKRMEKFAQYAFNKSHAACYAAIAMQTAYYKAHYEYEFMAGLLSSVMDDYDHFIPYYLECNQKGMTISHPNINTSLPVFSAENRNGEPCLIYGLGAIKNVTEETARKIVKEREENGDYVSLRDFIKRNPTVKKNSLTNLISAGCFDEFGKRKTMIEDLPDIIKEIRKPPKKSKKVDENQMSLFDLGLIEETPIEEKTPDYEFLDSKGEYDTLELLKKEKEVTGVYLSGHPTTSIIRKNNEIPIFELNKLVEKEEFDNEEVDEPINTDSENENENDKDDAPVIEEKKEEPKWHDGDIISIRAMITEKKERDTKKGDKMCTLKLEDETGELNAVIFPKRYQWLKNNLEVDTPYSITGELKLDGEYGLQIAVQSIDEIDKYRDSIYMKELKDMEKEKNDKQKLTYNPNLKPKKFIPSEELCTVEKSIDVHWINITSDENEKQVLDTLKSGKDFTILMKKDADGKRQVQYLSSDLSDKIDIVKGIVGEKGMMTEDGETLRKRNIKVLNEKLDEYIQKNYYDFSMVKDDELPFK